MTFSVSGSASVNISGQVTANAQKNSVLFLTAQDVDGTATETTMGTVGVGKVWRIISMHLSLYENSGSNNCSIKLNGTAAMTLWTQAANAPLNRSWNGSYADAIVLAAGQTVVLSAGTSCYCTANVYYVEESA